MADFKADGGLQAVQSSISGLESSFSSLAHIIPTQEMSSFNDSLYEMQRATHMSYTEITQFGKSIDILSKSTKHYSGIELVKMTHELHMNFGAMKALESASISYVKLLTTAFPQGADKASASMLRLYDTIPDIFDAMKSGTRDMATQWRILQVGGAETLGVYNKLVDTMKKGPDTKSINDFNELLKEMDANSQKVKKSLGNVAGGAAVSGYKALDKITGGSAGTITGAAGAGVGAAMHSLDFLSKAGWALQGLKGIGGVTGGKLGSLANKIPGMGNMGEKISAGVVNISAGSVSVNGDKTDSGAGAASSLFPSNMTLEPEAQTTAGLSFPKNMRLAPDTANYERFLGKRYGSFLGRGLAGAKNIATMDVSDAASGVWGAGKGLAKAGAGGIANLAKGGWGLATTGVGSAGFLGAGAAIGAGAVVGNVTGRWLDSAFRSKNNVNDYIGKQSTVGLAGSLIQGGISGAGTAVTGDDAKKQVINQQLQTMQLISDRAKGQLDIYQKQAAVRKSQAEIEFRMTGNAAKSAEIEKEAGNHLQRALDSEKNLLSILEKDADKKKDTADSLAAEQAVAEQRNKVENLNLEILDKEANILSNMISRHERLIAIGEKRLSLLKEYNNHFGKTKEAAQEEADIGVDNAWDRLEAAKDEIAKAKNIVGIRKAEAELVAREADLKEMTTERGKAEVQAEIDAAKINLEKAKKTDTVAIKEAEQKEKAASQGVHIAESERGLAVPRQQLELQEAINDSIQKRKEYVEKTFRNDKQVTDEYEKQKQGAIDLVDKTKALIAEKERQLTSEGVTNLEGNPDIVKLKTQLQGAETNKFEKTMESALKPLQLEQRRLASEDTLLGLMQNNAELLKDTKNSARYMLESKNVALKQLDKEKETYDIMYATGASSEMLIEQNEKIAQAQNKVYQKQDQYRTSWEQKFTQFAMGNVKGTAIYRGETSRAAQFGGAFQAFGGESRDREGNLIGRGTRASMAEKLGGGYTTKLQEDTLNTLKEIKGAIIEGGGATN